MEVSREVLETWRNTVLNVAIQTDRKKVMTLNKLDMIANQIQDLLDGNPMQESDIKPLEGGMTGGLIS